MVEINIKLCTPYDLEEVLHLARATFVATFVASFVAIFVITFVNTFVFAFVIPVIGFELGRPSST